MLQDGSWLPYTRLMELRFAINGKPKRIKIRQYEIFEIKRLNTIRSSIWYTAIKDLAESVGKQYYGSNAQTSPIASKNLSKDVAITVQPLPNHKLHSVYDLLVCQKRNRYFVSVDINVEEKIFQGKKKDCCISNFFEKEKAGSSQRESFFHKVRTHKIWP